MSLTTCIQRKPLLPPSPLGFQMKPLFSLPPLGQFVEPLGQNSNADELIFPSIQLSEISIASDENIASLSKSSESTSDIQLQENQIDSNSNSNSNNQSISNREFLSSDNISQANDEITVAPKIETEEKQLPEPLESLKPLAQNSDFYISRFVADYLSNKPGVYSTALSRSQNPIEDNQNIENIASTVTSEKNYQIEPAQQVNKIQTSLETVTSDSEDNLSSQSLSNSDLSNIEKQTEVLAKDNQVNSEFTPTSESNFQSDNQDITIVNTNKGLSKSPQLDTPDFNISSQINQSEAGNINKTPTDLNQTQLNSPALPKSNSAVPNLPDNIDGIELINQNIINSKQKLETAQIQTSATEDKLKPQLEPSLKTSSEATPELNPSNNKIEEQDVVESTPTYDNKLQTNIENDSNNNSENISENKHQPSNSPQNPEIQDSDSELIQSQLETAQIQTSATEDKLEPQLEPSFKTSSEATPELNPLTNQTEKQDVVESTPITENNSKNNSENISENKHQPSNSTQNQETPDSDSELIQPQLETAQIQTSATEDKLKPQLEPSLKTSSEATPELNPSKNQIEKQDVVESTPTYDNKLQHNIENDSKNNSESISENKHQPSNYPQNKEIRDSDSELIQPQLETAQIQTSATEDKLKPQLEPSLKTSSEATPEINLSNNKIEEQDVVESTPTYDNTLQQNIENDSKNNSENISENKHQPSKTSSDIPQTVQTNSENLTNKPEKSNYSQLSPLIQQSDLQLSKFVNDFSNLSATYSQNHLQAFTQSFQHNELYNFENPRFLQQSPEISSQISNNAPESKFNQNQNLNPNTIDFDKSINTNDEGKLSLNNDFLNNETSKNDANLINTKLENNHRQANNDVIPDSWSNISELIENTSPDKLQQSPNISEINNQHYDDTQFTNASSPNQVNSHNNQYISQPKAADSQLNESETNHISNHQINDTWSNVSELIAKNYQQPSEILKKTTDELTSLYSNINQEELTSSHNITSQSENSPDTKHKSINDEELNILAYQIYTIIRQKLEVDRECLGRELFGYSEWSNIIPLNLSIGSYHKINQVDFLQPKMNLLAIEVYKLISIRLEVEKERCIR